MIIFGGTIFGRKIFLIKKKNVSDNALRYGYVQLCIKVT